MIRRLHIPSIQSIVGDAIALPNAQAHHARDVLRLTSGTEVELFDNAGTIASATIEQCDANGVILRIQTLVEPLTGPMTDCHSLTIVAAIPKGDRADWMIEKLSEIGVNEFVPLIAERSVVIPGGQNKRDRWQRIATESAKQSRRTGVMTISPMVSLVQWIAQPKEHRAGLLSTAPNAEPISEWIAKSANQPLALLIGPEGGWTDSELTRCDEAKISALRLTRTILRVETAAIVAAGIVAAGNVTARNVTAR